MEKKQLDIAAKADDLKNNLVDKYREFDDQYETTRDKVYAVNDNAIRLIEENPVIAIAAALSIGYLIGRIASRRWIV